MLLYILLILYSVYNRKGQKGLHLIPPTPTLTTTSRLTLCCYFLRYQQLIKENLKDVARLITTEQGKTLPDAEGDVMRGLQVS